MKIWDVNVDNTVISKLVKYLTGYLDKAIKPLVLIIPKMSGYVKTLKLKKETKIKTINQCLSV